MAPFDPTLCSSQERQDSAGRQVQRRTKDFLLGTKRPGCGVSHHWTPTLGSRRNTRLRTSVILAPLNNESRTLSVCSWWWPPTHRTRLPRLGGLSRHRIFLILPFAGQGDSVAGRGRSRPVLTRESRPLHRSTCRTTFSDQRTAWQILVLQWLCSRSRAVRSGR